MSKLIDEYPYLIALLFVLIIISALYAIGLETLPTMALVFLLAYEFGCGAEIIEKKEKVSGQQWLILLLTLAAHLAGWLYTNGILFPKEKIDSGMWFPALLCSTIAVLFPLVFWGLLFLIDLYTLKKHNYSCVSKMLHQPFETNDYSPSIPHAPMHMSFPSNYKPSHFREVKGYDYCPYCGSDDIIQYNDGTKECNDCDMVW